MAGVCPDGRFAILAVEPIAIDPIDPSAGVEHPEEQPVAVQKATLALGEAFHPSRRQFACHDPFGSLLSAEQGTALFFPYADVAFRDIS
jgi:hypothetical protein